MRTLDAQSCTRYVAYPCHSAIHTHTCLLECDQESSCCSLAPAHTGGSAQQTFAGKSYRGGEEVEVGVCVRSYQGLFPHPPPIPLSQSSLLLDSLGLSASLLHSSSLTPHPSRSTLPFSHSTVTLSPSTFESTQFTVADNVQRTGSAGDRIVKDMDGLFCLVSFSAFCHTLFNVAFHLSLPPSLPPSPSLPP